MRHVLPVPIGERILQLLVEREGLRALSIQGGTVFKIFKRTPPARMEQVCELCYKNAKPVDRILMVMVANSQCERETWLNR